MLLGHRNMRRNETNGPAFQHPFPAIKPMNIDDDDDDDDDDRLVVDMGQASLILRGQKSKNATNMHVGQEFSRTANSRRSSILKLPLACQNTCEVVSQNDTAARLLPLVDG